MFASGDLVAELLRVSTTGFGSARAVTTTARGIWCSTVSMPLVDSSKVKVSTEHPELGDMINGIYLLRAASGP